MIFEKKRVLRIAQIVGIILLIPLFGDLFVNGWNWGIGDFIFAFVSLFVTGLLIDFVRRKLTNPLSRSLAIAAIVLTFLLVWVELATDGGLSERIVIFF